MTKIILKRKWQNKCSWEYSLSHSYLTFGSSDLYWYLRCGYERCALGRRVQEDVQMVSYLELNFWGTAGLLGHYPIQWPIRYMLVNYVDCFSKNPRKMRIFLQSQRNHIWEWNDFNKSILTTLSWGTKHSCVQ